MESKQLEKAGAARRSPTTGRAPTAVVEPNNANGVIVECILQPTCSRRRHPYPLDTTISHIASEIESVLVVPAKVEAISLFEIDFTNASSSSLALDTTLKELGARVDSVFTLWVALRRVEEIKKSGADPGEKDDSNQAKKEEFHQGGGAKVEGEETGLETGAELLDEEKNLSPDLAIAIERWRAFSAGTPCHSRDVTRTRNGAVTSVVH